MATNNASNEPTAASGKLWQSQGIGTVSAFTTATYPSTATGTGTILRADGTNWTASTSTYPNTNAINTLLYASSANVMSALATANSGVLTTDSSGVPSIDTTNFSRLTTGMQMKGNNTNTAPPAGFIGEQIRSAIASASAVSFTSSASAVNVTSINLTAGIWDISGICSFNTATTQGVSGSISATSGVVGTDGDSQAQTSATWVSGVATSSVSIPSYRVTLSTTTTYYLVANAVYSGGNPKVFGRISATRVG